MLSLFFTSTCPVVQILALMLGLFFPPGQGGWGIWIRTLCQLCASVCAALWIIWRGGTEENKKSGMRDANNVVFLNC